MIDYRELLSDTVVLLCHPNQETRRKMRGLLRIVGANVISARNPMESNGVLLKMFKNEHSPHHIITSWWLEETNSDSFRFWHTLGQVQQASCLSLIDNADNLLGDKVAMTIWSPDHRVAIPLQPKRSIILDTLDQEGDTPIDVVLKVAARENLRKKHFQAIEDCKRLMADESLKDIIRQAAQRLDGNQTRYVYRHPSQA